MKPNYLHTVYPISEVSVLTINDTNKDCCNVEMWKRTGDKRKPLSFACTIFTGTFKECFERVQTEKAM